MIKRSIQKIIGSLGYEIKKKEIKNQVFDKILKKRLDNKPIIFDVGANQGQSIKRFKSIFSDPIIHSFEPLKEDFLKMDNEFKNDNKVFLNNFAVGDKIEVKNLNITKKSDNSSFNDITIGTEWLKKRSKQNNTDETGYVSRIEEVNVIKLDDYIIENKIETIDILKIDTQGYEDKVLDGCFESIKQNKIKIIITEIILDNNYSKYLNFLDIEKNLIPNNFRLVGIDLANPDLFSGIVFAADLMYFNKNRLECFE